MTTIFLSYARGDDEPFVKLLYESLVARGFDVWWDRVCMPSRGLTFLREIRDAVNARQRLVLVVGPKAVTSDYVIAEWQHANTFGKPITPVLRLGDYPLVPDDLKLLHTEDFRDDTQYAFHLDNLVRQLSEEVPPMGKLIGVPSLPRHLLARPDRLADLKNALLADEKRPVVMTGVAARVGMHGMGGIGKSVLANLLARDTQIRQAFPDGIVWIPLGTKPDLADLLRSVAKMFDDAAGYFDNVHEGKAKVKELLESKAVLLMLDDVWERRHAEAFDVLGPRCRAVITTRDAGLVTSLGGSQHQVRLLSEAESLNLLASAAGLAAEVLPGEARPIISKCDGLPLALALCGGMARAGVTWAGILQRLQQAALESIAARHPAQEQHGSIWAAMKVSVDALTADERQRFVELSVFPEDERVPEAAVRTLWTHAGLSAFACEDLLISLHERSLILLNNDTPSSGEAPRRRVSLHDLLHDFATRLAGDPAALHGKLLDAYRKQCPKGWPSGPNDGYFFQRLHHHLIASGSKEESRKLLLDFDWLWAKLSATDTTALIADYDLGTADDDALRTVQGALRLSAHVLNQDKTPLPSQLLGRLLSCKTEHIQALLNQARNWKATPWMCPLTASLTPPGGPLLRTLTGHADMVMSVAVTLDGRLALSGSNDNTVKVWDLASGREIRTLAGHTDRVTSLAVTPDSLALSGSKDHTVKVWDLASGREVRTLPGHSDTVTSLAVTPDGRLALSGSHDKTVKVWDLASGREVRTLAGHTAKVNALAVTPDGSLVLSGSGDWTVKVWDLASGRKVRTLAGHTSGVTLGSMRWR